ncbi:alcohol oxidase [Apiospora phragmitis]|uniref:Alcohol oxidase n=1 Tax=Apiospora phragmitis TaxID=2905665 RepID=A0ABR1VEQ5_9PEZI
MVSKGMPLDHDMFSHGENPQGCGHPPRTVHQGIRTTGADFITKNNQRHNIIILVETHVDKVCGSSSRTAPPPGSRAKKEVIVSGGAYCSPNILNRSRIGARHDLAPLGISTLVDLPGVGRNLMDHLLVFMFYETDRAGLTNDHLVYHGDAFKTTYQLWKDEWSGFLSTFPFGAFAYARLDDRLADSAVWNAAPRRPGRDPMGLTPRQPHVEFFNTECYGGPKQYDQFPVDGEHAFSMIAELFGAQSRGSVRLRSADPLDKPEVLAEACRLGNEIVMEGKGTRDIVKGSWPLELTHHTNKTREDWIPYVKDHATTCYHASGTCAMGKKDNPNAVVDEQLVVKGVKNLRVADASIIPILGGFHTQMPAYGIGEKCADLIIKRWKQLK